MNLNNKTRFLYFILGLLIVFVLVVILVIALLNNSQTQITNFEECKSAGGLIMESYPEQCRIRNLTFVRELTEEEKNNIKPPVTEFYGESTFAVCNSDSECIVSGCNTEICQGSNEDPLISICIAPDQPLPQDLGYSCGCVSNTCQWSK